MTHWGPYNPNGEQCRFCSNPPYPPIRSSADVRDFLACSEARLPPLWLRLTGILSELSR